MLDDQLPKDELTQDPAPVENAPVNDGPIDPPKKKRYETFDSVIGQLRESKGGSAPILQTEETVEQLRVKYGSSPEGIRSLYDLGREGGAWDSRATFEVFEQQIGGQDLYVKDIDGDGIADFEDATAGLPTPDQPSQSELLDLQQYERLKALPSETNQKVNASLVKLEAHIAQERMLGKAAQALKGVSDTFSVDQAPRPTGLSSDGNVAFAEGAQRISPAGAQAVHDLDFRKANQGHVDAITSISYKDLQEKPIPSVIEAALNDDESSKAWANKLMARLEEFPDTTIDDSGLVVTGRLLDNRIRKSQGVIETELYAIRREVGDEKYNRLVGLRQLAISADPAIDSVREKLHSSDENERSMAAETLAGIASGQIEGANEEEAEAAAAFAAYQVYIAENPELAKADKMMTAMASLEVAHSQLSEKFPAYAKFVREKSAAKKAADKEQAAGGWFGGYGELAWNAVKRTGAETLSGVAQMSADLLDLVDDPESYGWVDDWADKVEYYTDLDSYASTVTPSNVRSITSSQIDMKGFDGMGDVKMEFDPYGRPTGIFDENDLPIDPPGTSYADSKLKKYTDRYNANPDKFPTPTVQVNGKSMAYTGARVTAAIGSVIIPGAAAGRVAKSATTAKALIGGISGAQAYYGARNQALSILGDEEEDLATAVGLITAGVTAWLTLRIGKTEQALSGINSLVDDAAMNALRQELAKTGNKEAALATFRNQLMKRTGDIYSRFREGGFSIMAEAAEGAAETLVEHGALAAATGVAEDELTEYDMTNLPTDLAMGVVAESVVSVPTAVFFAKGRNARRKEALTELFGMGDRDKAIDLAAGKSEMSSDQRRVLELTLEQADEARSNGKVVTPEALDALFNMNLTGSTIGANMTPSTAPSTPVTSTSPVPESAPVPESGTSQFSEQAPVSENENTSNSETPYDPAARLDSVQKQLEQNKQDLADAQQSTLLTSADEAIRTQAEQNVKDLELSVTKSTEDLGIAESRLRSAKEIATDPDGNMVPLGKYEDDPRGKALLESDQNLFEIQKSLASETNQEKLTDLNKRRREWIERRSDIEDGRLNPEEIVRPSPDNSAKKVSPKPDEKVDDSPATVQSMKNAIAQLEAELADPEVPSEHKEIVLAPKLRRYKKYKEALEDGYETLGTDSESTTPKSEQQTLKFSQQVSEQGSAALARKYFAEERYKKALFSDDHNSSDPEVVKAAISELENSRIAFEQASEFAELNLDKGKVFEQEYVLDGYAKIQDQPELLNTAGHLVNANGQELTVSQVAAATGTTESAAAANLAELTETGLVINLGNGRHVFPFSIEAAKFAEDRVNNIDARIDQIDSQIKATEAELKFSKQHGRKKRKSKAKARLKDLRKAKDINERNRKRSEFEIEGESQTENTQNTAQLDADPTNPEPETENTQNTAQLEVDRAEQLVEHAELDQQFRENNTTEAQLERQYAALRDRAMDELDGNTEPDFLITRPELKNFDRHYEGDGKAKSTTELEEMLVNAPAAWRAPLRDLVEISSGEDGVAVHIHRTQEAARSFLQSRNYHQPEGFINGFHVPNGKGEVHVVLDGLRADTPIHELAHNSVHLSSVADPGFLESAVIEAAESDMGTPELRKAVRSEDPDIMEEAFAKWTGDIASGAIPTPEALPFRKLLRVASQEGDLDSPVMRFLNNAIGVDPKGLSTPREVRRMARLMNKRLQKQQSIRKNKGKPEQIRFSKITAAERQLINDYISSRNMSKVVSHEQAARDNNLPSNLSDKAQEMYQNQKLRSLPTRRIAQFKRFFKSKFISDWQLIDGDDGDLDSSARISHERMRGKIQYGKTIAANRSRAINDGIDVSIFDRVRKALNAPVTKKYLTEDEVGDYLLGKLHPTQVSNLATKDPKIFAELERARMELDDLQTEIAGLGSISGKTYTVEDPIDPTKTVEMRFDTYMLDSRFSSPERQAKFGSKAFREAYLRKFYRAHTEAGYAPGTKTLREATDMRMAELYSPPLEIELSNGQIIDKSDARFRDLIKKYYSTPSFLRADGSVVQHGTSEFNRRLRHYAMEDLNETLQRQFDEGRAAAEDPNAKDDIIKKRKEIPPSYRHVLGEVTDPVARYVKSVEMLSRYLEGYKALDNLLDLMPETFAKVDSPTRTEEGLTMPLSGVRFGPLDGMYTTPEMHEFLSQRADSPTGAMAVFNKFNAEVQQNVTLFRTATQSGNFISSGTRAFANGNLFSRSGLENAWNLTMANVGVKTLISDGLAGTQELKMANPEGYAMLEFLTADGTTGSDVAFRRIQESFEGSGGMLKVIEAQGERGAKFARRLRRTQRDAEDLINSSKVAKKTADVVALPFKGAASIYHTMTRLYVAGDDFWKIWSFAAEVDRLARKNHGKKAKDLSVDDRRALWPEASETVKLTMQNYNRVGEFGKDLSRLLFLSQFASFPLEVGRTTYNLGAVTARDFKNGDYLTAANRTIMATTAFWAGKAMVEGMLHHGAAELQDLMEAGEFDLENPNDTPEEAELRRAIHNGLAVKTPSTLYAWMFDEESLKDLKAVRTLQPHWREDSDLLVTGFDDEGEFTVWDLSANDFNGLFHKAMNAYILSDTPTDKALGVANNFGKIVYDPKISSNIITNQITGENAHGMPITRPDLKGVTLQNTQSRAFDAAKSGAIPGFYMEGLNLYESAQESTTELLFESFAMATRFRRSKTNPIKQVSRAMSAYARDGGIKSQAYMYADRPYFKAMSKVFDAEVIPDDFDLDEFLVELEDANRHAKEQLLIIRDQYNAARRCITRFCDDQEKEDILLARLTVSVLDGGQLNAAERAIVFLGVDIPDPEYIRKKSLEKIVEGQRSSK